MVRVGLARSRREDEVERRRPNGRRAASLDGDAQEGDDKAGRQFIGALARGLRVLRSFRANDPPLSNQELARRAGLPRPTISRITYTLTELGYLTYHERLGCYELGGATLALGHVARSNFDALSRARPAMERMAEASGANVGLGTRERLHMVYLEACQGPSLIGLRLNVGSRVPILHSAMGSAYLASVSNRERSALMKQIVREQDVDPQEVQGVVDRAVEELSTFGFCVSTGEWQPEIHGVAVPISAPELGSHLVVNCGGPAYSLPRERLLKEIGPALLRTARQIKDGLGSNSSHEHEDSGSRGDVQPLRRASPRK